VLAARRRQSLAVLSRKRKATVITLIHRQETVSLLGIPLARYIDIDDAQGILRAIRETPPDRRSRSCSTRPAGSSWPRSRSPRH
jgi:ClpP class serine protease